ncbi:MAG: acyltransferase [Acidobacteriota bacterium]
MVLAFLPSWLLGPLVFLLFVGNTVLWSLPLYIMALFKILLPFRGWRRAWTRAITAIAETWTTFNNWGLSLTQRIHWDVRGVEGLTRKGWYLVSCNHRSWVDIVVLQRIFNRRIPFPKFFLKRSLAWVPLLGGAWWALDYPFMRRYSRSYLERHPEKRGKDLETTRKACERFAGVPVTILNFLEGTRFSRAKHALQESPYRHLLRPKAGGLAFVLAAMGDRMRHLLDVTIVYPKESPTLWDLLSGKLRKIVVHVERLEIPEEFSRGDYLDDPVLRERFQEWVRELWARKDALIERLRQEAGFLSAPPQPA